MSVNNPKDAFETNQDATYVSFEFVNAAKQYGHLIEDPPLFFLLVACLIIKGWGH